jgi:putative ABC transport system permease protein
MLDIVKIAARNLRRFSRRTLLTSSLVTLGIVGVLLFVAVSGSFKAIMIGQFTDAILGHLQVHRKGYVASIDTLPLNLNMPPATVARVEKILDASDAVEAYSERIKIGAMFSNFTETTSIRINGVDPERELATTPLLAGRMREGSRDGPLLKPGEILVPVLLARGMNVKVGGTIVLVATNRDGSVNGKTFVVRGVLESASGPSGKDGYISLKDARELLRLTGPEVSEIAVRLKSPARLDDIQVRLSRELSAAADEGEGPGLEVHTWAELSPFASIVRMIDLLAVFIRIMMVAIVLISVMNVMMMAVYERIREIGTLSAIGTPPRRILALFLTEGLLLGLGGTALGTLVSLAIVYALNLWPITFDFAMQQGIVLAPAVSARDVLGLAALVLIMALLASLQPAWKASRMDPVTALGHV